MSHPAGAPKEEFGDPNTVEITEPDPRYKCCFCGRHEINSAEWGSLLKLDTIVTHHFCLLFSAKGEQLGRDNEGIQAFLPADIKKELRRGSKLKCKFCKKANATIGCVVPKCPYSYHYTCGYENGCLSQFYDQYESFCPNHKPKQQIPISAFDDSADYTTCPICMVDTEMDEAIWPPCCGKQLMHRRCIMHTAKAAGYFFKCPLCNSKDPVFMQAMKANGVFVPEQDASWELEPNAFQELRFKYSVCDAKDCLCPDGREFNKNMSMDWNLVRCHSCGSSATHAKCSGLEVFKWRCDGCRVIFKDSIALEPESDEGLVSETSDENSIADSQSSNGVLSDPEEGLELSNHGTISIEDMPWSPTPALSPGNDENEVPEFIPPNESKSKVGSCNLGEERIEVLRSAEHSEGATSNPFTVLETSISNLARAGGVGKGTKRSMKTDEEPPSSSHCSKRNRIRNPNVSIPKQTIVPNEDNEPSEAKKLEEQNRYAALQAKMHSISVDRKKKRELDAMAILKAIGAPSADEVRKLPRIPKKLRNETECSSRKPYSPPQFGFNDRGPILNVVTEPCSVPIDDPDEYKQNHSIHKVNTWIQYNEFSFQDKTEQKHSHTYTTNFTDASLGSMSGNPVMRNRPFQPVPGPSTTMSTIQHRLYQMAYGKDQPLNSREPPSTLVNKVLAPLNRYERWANPGPAQSNPGSTITSSNVKTPIEVIDLDDSDDDVAMADDVSDDIILEKIVLRRASLKSSLTIANQYQITTGAKMQLESKEREHTGMDTSNQTNGKSRQLTANLGSSQSAGIGDTQEVSFHACENEAGSCGEGQQKVNSDRAVEETGPWNDADEAQSCPQRRRKRSVTNDYWLSTNEPDDDGCDADAQCSQGRCHSSSYPNQPPNSNGERQSPPERLEDAKRTRLDLQ